MPDRDPLPERILAALADAADDVAKLIVLAILFPLMTVALMGAAEVVKVLP